jgi:hypothetical protein
MLAIPLKYLISLVYSAMKVRFLHWHIVQGSVTWPKVQVRGLWFMKVVNGVSSSINRKCLILL